MRRWEKQLKIQKGITKSLYTFRETSVQPDNLKYNIEFVNFAIKFVFNVTLSKSNR